MRSTTFLALMWSLIPTSAHTQECGCEVSANRGFGAGYAGPTEQLYPFNRQDPWLHGQYQRVPSYGGYSSFRPYNYRHVLPQARIAAQFGVASGMNYSHLHSNRNSQKIAYDRPQDQSTPTHRQSSGGTSVLRPIPRPISMSRTIEKRR